MAYPDIQITLTVKPDQGNQPSTGDPTAMSADAQARMVDKLTEFGTAIVVTVP